MQLLRRRLNTTDAAAYLGGDKISPRTMERWRWAGGGPVFIRLGKHVVYDVGDLDAYAASKRRTSTTAPAPEPVAA